MKRLFIIYFSFALLIFYSCKFQRENNERDPVSSKVDTALSEEDCAGLNLFDANQISYDLDQMKIDLNQVATTQLNETAYFIQTDDATV